MYQVNILWADDEIDLLKPHIMFLEAKGYKLSTVVSGNEALDLVKEQHFDIIFLDENMPGLSGLDTLVEIKKIRKSVPVVMITKSEEEYIMEEAIGGEISDYLIKPVNPNQILLSIKKNLDEKRLVNEHSTQAYQREFRQISMKLSDQLDYDDWVQLYKDLVYWELKLGNGADNDMLEILNSQKLEANQQFSRFIENNYLDWMQSGEDKPLLSNQVFEQVIIPDLGTKPVFVFVVDCLRYDQWKVMQQEISQYFVTEKDDCYYSILPTTTQYARNSLFSGLLPSDIQKKFPKHWIDEDDDESKNNYEEFFQEELLKRKGLNLKTKYEKITNLNKAKKVVDNFHQYFQNDLTTIVYNFVDALSHARTDTKIIRELAEDEKAYRSLTKSWFIHSPFLEMLKKIAEKDAILYITTDHGSVKVDEPSQMIADKSVNNNLRYKVGKSMQYKEHDVFEIKDLSAAKLPKSNFNSKFIFAKENKFFAYKNNYNHYAKYYKDTFQHGGISMEEVIIPIVKLKRK
ncbi:MAG: CheY-like chemotaxis protein [Saprospiraceae bacterium]|jgi:CheY-like chemotaxis protein